MAMSLADLVLQDASGLGQLAYFLVAGLAWVPPAAFVVWLMFRPSKAGQR